MTTTNPKFKVGVANDEEVQRSLPNIQKDFWINLLAEKEIAAIKAQLLLL
jgi:hypothetical protein